MSDQSRRPRAATIVALGVGLPQSERRGLISERQERGRDVARSAADSERPNMPPKSMTTMLSPSAGINAIPTILQLIVLEVIAALR